MVAAAERWCEATVGGRADLRVVGRSALHVTLCFLGPRPAGELEPIVAACERVRGSPARGLTLGRALWLPRRRPHALALGMLDGRGELAALQAQLAAALVATGVLRPEPRGFLPHVTVARVRRGARVAASELSAPPALGFDGARMILWRSHLGIGPAQYTPLHAVDLART